MKLTLVTTHSTEPVVTPIHEQATSFEFIFLFAIIPWSSLSEAKLEINHNTRLHFKKSVSATGSVTFVKNGIKLVHNHIYRTIKEVTTTFDSFRRKPKEFLELMDFISPEEFQRNKSTFTKCSSTEISDKSLTDLIFHEDISRKSKEKHSASMTTMAVILLMILIVIFILKNS